MTTSTPLPISDWVTATIERSWQVGSYQALEEFELEIAAYLQNQLKP
ncbi:MAG: hypothetical protein KME35_01745 [Aphanocapsa sp. GSE-SYN-MK-11-07L]|jgi:hypothetical protein|nr:hypothetical protein [Aphanocapsa sp. GSE-SYN-MK-11-07L]